MPYSSTRARWVSFPVSHTSFPHVWCQVCSAGSRLVVQESVAERVVAKIRERMTHLRLGDSLDKVIIRGAYPAYMVYGYCLLSLWGILIPPPLLEYRYYLHYSTHSPSIRL